MGVVIGKSAVYYFNRDYVHIRIIMCAYLIVSTNSVYRVGVSTSSEVDTYNHV